MNSEQDNETIVVLVVNGDYAGALVEAAEVLVGGLSVEVIKSACLHGSSDLRSRVHGQLAEKTAGRQQVLLLSDLCGSTPSNVCQDLVEKNPGWELLTGLNLPMLLKLATCDRRLGAREMASCLRATALESIKLGSSFLPEEGHHAG